MTPQKTARSRSDAGKEIRLDLARYFPHQITSIANRWARNSASLYLKTFNITMGEWRLIALLAVEPWISSARVDAVIGMDKASLSRAVRLAEARGLVETRASKEDTRRREMTLTPAGRALQSEVAETALAREDELLACLNTAERRTLLALLVRVHAHMAEIGM